MITASAISPGSWRRRARDTEPPETRDGFMDAKGSACVIGLAVIGAVLWPIIENWRRAPRDGFPLSYYPMFSIKRSKRLRVTYLVGLDRANNRYFLPYRYAGVGGLNQVRRQISRTIEAGREGQLCESVASAVAERRGSRVAEVVVVQIVRGEYRLAGYFAGKKQPLTERVLTSYAVERYAS